MEEDIKKAIEHLEWSQSQMRLGNLPDYDRRVYKSVENILNELEKLEKEFKAVDHECSRLEQKETELEKENENLREHNHNLIKQNRKDKDFLLNRLDKLENALNSEKTVQKCLHCNEDTPLYCEKCYQELISKNAELQMRYEKINKFLHSNSFVFQNENGDIQGMLLTPENFIPKQVIRDKIKKLKNEFDFYAGREHAEWQDGEFDGDVCDDLALQIKVLKELLGDE